MLPGAYGVERLPEKGARMSAAWSAGIFHVALPFASHWRSTSSICVTSTIPATSILPSETTSASVPRIGPLAEVVSDGKIDVAGIVDRSEEHTSELQSRGHLVCRLLLE